MDPTTLCELLIKHTPSEFYKLLQSLVDFLKMPGTARNWLPPLQQISMMHAGVERLHYDPMAKAAVEAILTYMPFSSSERRSPASSARSAMFRISVHGAGLDNCRCAAGEYVAVHAVHTFQSHRPRRDGDGRVIEDTLCLGYSIVKYTQVLPRTEQQSASLQLPCWGQVVDANCVLGGCIDSEFAAVLQQLPGGAGRVNIKCARYLRDNSPGQGMGAPHGERPSPSVFHLWLVSWWVGRGTWFMSAAYMHAWMLQQL